MTRHVLHKRSNVVTDGVVKLPTADQIEYGEIAINYAKDNECLSLKNSNNEIVTFSTDAQLKNELGNYVAKSGDTMTGSLTVQGDITASGVVYSSDRKLKENIRPLEDDILTKVMKLTPTRYNFKSDELKQEEIGFIAQEVREVFPEYVREKEDTQYVDYAKMCSILCKAVQELNQKVTDLQNQLNEIK